MFRINFKLYRHVFACFKETTHRNRLEVRDSLCAVYYIVPRL